MKLENMPMPLANDIELFPTGPEEIVQWHGLTDLTLGEERANSVFLLAVLSRFEVSRFHIWGFEKVSIQ